MFPFFAFMPSLRGLPLLDVWTDKDPSSGCENNVGEMSAGLVRNSDKRFYDLYGEIAWIH